VEAGKGRLIMAPPFAETEPFVAPVGVGNPVLILLQREDSDITTAAAELGLQVTGGTYRVLSFGAGQHMVWLDEEADYAFNVLRYGGIVGSMPVVRAHAVVRLRTSAVTVVDTTGENGCTSRSEVPTDQLLLHANQVARLTIIGLDSFSLATAGFLSLDFSSLPAQLRIDSDSIFSGGGANQITLRPAATLGAEASFIVTDRTSGQSLQVRVPTTSDLAPCE
jgi:hypothetical protein